MGNYFIHRACTLDKLKKYACMQSRFPIYLIQEKRRNYQSVAYLRIFFL